jgi:hypothetical protein
VVFHFDFGDVPLCSISLWQSVPFLVGRSAGG